MARKKRKKRKVLVVRTNDPFAKAGTTPSYRDVATLKNYLTDRGKILAKSRSGLTSKSQRALALAVKRARHLALLPFVVKAK